MFRTNILVWAGVAVQRQKLGGQAKLSLSIRCLNTRIRSTCQDLIYFDQWSEEEAKRHSSQLEMDAAVRSIKHFMLKKDAWNTQWLHKSDSTTVVSYLNKKGGKKPELDHMAVDLWEFCLEWKILSCSGRSI